MGLGSLYKSRTSNLRAQVAARSTVVRTFGGFWRDVRGAYEAREAGVARAADSEHPGRAVYP